MYLSSSQDVFFWSLLLPFDVIQWIYLESCLFTPQELLLLSLLKMQKLLFPYVSLRDEVSHLY